MKKYYWSILGLLTLFCTCNPKKQENVNLEVSFVPDSSCEIKKEISKSYYQEDFVLFGCVVNHPYTLEGFIANKGDSPLSISDIQVSCDCVRLVSSKKMRICSMEQKQLKIVFTPDVEGHIYRELYLISEEESVIKTISFTAKINTDTELKNKELAEAEKHIE